MSKQKTYADLKEILHKEYERKCKNDHENNDMFESVVKQDVLMKDYTSFKVGGPADILIDPGDIARLIAAIDYLYKEKIPYIILGNGSNVIIRDGGYRGAVILMQSKIDGAPMAGGMENYANTPNIVTANAGILLSTLAKAVAAKGLTGFEPLSGIPGTLGGAVFMNAGAYGGEIKDTIKSVTAYDPKTNRTETISKEDMNLSYRHSAFQESGRIILDATFELTEGDKEQISRTMRELTQKRNAKQPVNLPSAGSFFKRPEGHFAGKLIEDSGLKGLRKGGAQISELHSGFMVNTGGATAQDIEDLMQVVKTAVYDKFGVMLEPEVRIMGEY